MPRKISKSANKFLSILLTMLLAFSMTPVGASLTI